MLASTDIPIQSRVMPHLLAEVLESAVIFGDMAPGSRIIEEEIAARHGVSRSPVREALRRLESEGLVIREERRGARVAEVSREDLDEVYICRIELEGLAAQYAAKNWSPSALDALSARLEDMKRAHSSRAVRDYFVANVGFTTSIHEAAGNRTLKRLLGSIAKQALRYRFFAYRSAPSLMELSIEGNSRILSLIGDRNGREARKVTEQLIERSWKTIRELIPDA